MVSEPLDRETVGKIRELGEMLAEEHGWAAMDMDLRQVLADHGLPRTDRAEQELEHHIVWLLS